MLTNKLNLPEPILRAAEREMYSKGDARYSVTELIKPARMAALQRLYGDSIVEDVADNIWSVLGRIGHGILEASGAPVTGAILEERLYADVLNVRISGAMDHTVLLPTGCLDDYKFTNVYAVSHGVKFEWEAQLNIYAWLRSLAGQTVERLRVVAILRDWTISRARSAGHIWEAVTVHGECCKDGECESPGYQIVGSGGPDADAKYPSHQVKVVEIPLWGNEKTQGYVEERVRAHLEADTWATNGDREEPLPAMEPHCTDEERWVRPTRYAFMKRSRKTAVKLYDSLEEAQMVANATPGGYTEVRGGEPVRCIDYCTVGRAGLCTQYESDKPRFASTANAIDTSAFD